MDLLTILAIFLAIIVITASAGNNGGPGLHKDFPLAFRIAAQVRVPVLMFFVTPLSFLRWLYASCRREVRRAFPAVVIPHDVKVQGIIDEIKTWNDAGRPGRLRTARPTWATMSTKLGNGKKDAYKVKVSGFDTILDCDFEKGTITCEPGVTMGQITDHLLPQGHALEIQVEMESITIAGVTVGFGMETASHRVGFFQETIVAFELVTSEGEVKQVTEESDRELFFALPWSYGTLGFLTSVTVRIVPVKEYIHMHYIPTYSNKDFHEKFNELACADDAPEFLEATLYSKETGVIQCGYFADKPQSASDRKKINSVNYFWKPFYFKWVETFLEKGKSDEFIPLKHYYHRFTRSIFWELEDMIPFSNHPVYRALWGWMGAPEVGLLKLFQGPVIRKASIYAHVVQESIMPIKKLAEGVEKFDDWFGVYPLLAFPLRVYDREECSGFLHPRKENLLPGKNYGLWVDLGAYGPPRAVKQGKFWNPKPHIREMEHWTREIGGFQAVYTDLFCTPNEFRQMFDHSLLDKTRKRLNALDAFPEVFSKVKSEEGLIDLKDELEAERKAAAKAK